MRCLLFVDCFVLCGVVVHYSSFAGCWSLLCAVHCELFVARCLLPRVCDSLIAVLCVFFDCVLPVVCVVWCALCAVLYDVCCLLSVDVCYWLLVSC